MRCRYEVGSQACKLALHKYILYMAGLTWSCISFSSERALRGGGVQYTGGCSDIVCGGGGTLSLTHTHNMHTHSPLQSYVLCRLLVLGAYTPGVIDSTYHTDGHQNYKDRERDVNIGGDSPPLCAQPPGVSRLPILNHLLLLHRASLIHSSRPTVSGSGPGRSRRRVKQNCRVTVVPDNIVCRTVYGKAYRTLV